MLANIKRLRLQNKDKPLIITSLKVSYNLHIIIKIIDKLNNR
jgi:hypothetical protein